MVVVPAVADPAGAYEARLRQWIVERHRRGARVLGVCAGSEPLGAVGQRYMPDSGSPRCSPWHPDAVGSCRSW
ncbi:hypothetical protein ACFVYE_03540 [Streptomyces sp. NPDC058239]|uniref:hypothetical protein n=1 Tax=Streptomyces sp. NPDC058239 TaxID=3346395 RepID=UPI0036E68125